MVYRVLLHYRFHTLGPFEIFFYIPKWIVGAFMFDSLLCTADRSKLSATLQYHVI